MLKALLEKRAKLVADMTAIITAAETDNRELTAEEQTQFDNWKAEKASLDGRIDNAGMIEEANTEMKQTRPAAARGAGLNPRPAGPEAPREFASLGEFLHAVRFNTNDPRLVYGERDEGDGLRSEMRMDQGTSGGFLIPPRFVDTILKIPAQDALVRPRANVIPAGTPPDQAVTIPALDQSGATQPNSNFGGMTFAWIGEGQLKPDTSALLRNVTLTPHEIAGTVTVTDKLLRNWPAASAFLESLMRSGVAAAEDLAFLQGTGNGQPLGVTNAGASYVQSRTSGGLVKYADLVNMVARVLMRSGTSPVWSMPQSVLPQIATLVDPLGHYIFVPNAAAGIGVGFAGTLLGYPLRWNNRAPLLGTKGDVILADWSYYLIKDGSGPYVASSEHVYFQSNKTMIKIFWNVDGSPWLTAPFKEENGYQVSPFVVLNT